MANNDEDYPTISFEDKASISAAIQENCSFRLTHIEDRETAAVTWIRDEIKKQGKTSLTYTSGRWFYALGLALVPFGPVLAAASAVKFAAENIRSPDFTIRHGLWTNFVQVTHQGNNDSWEFTNEAKAEYAKKIEKMTEQLKSYYSTIQEHKKYFDNILAMAAIGLSAANCDGKIHGEEQNSLNLFLAGINHPNLPDWVKFKLDAMCKAPPNLRTAYAKAQDAQIPDDLIEEIIEVVIYADGVIHPEERAFLAAWRNLKSAA